MAMPGGRRRLLARHAIATRTISAPAISSVVPSAICDPVSLPVTGSGGCGRTMLTVVLATRPVVSPVAVMVTVPVRLNRTRTENSPVTLARTVSVVGSRCTVGACCPIGSIAPTPPLSCTAASAPSASGVRVKVSRTSSLPPKPEPKTVKVWFTSTVGSLTVSAGGCGGYGGCGSGWACAGDPAMANAPTVASAATAEPIMRDSRMMDPSLY
ncbi:hypothetical protein ABNF97_24745 [Plantactinospora sp. B6F1]|uniref:hypothetical protein n=1 Tax=Plantactinospora sp. B6F1 TaxID=3158971 RepID=UPI0032D8F732